MSNTTLTQATNSWGDTPVQIGGNWREMLQGFPPEFRYLPILDGGNGKTPTRPDTQSTKEWEQHPGIPLEQLLSMNGVVRASSLLLGEKSNGLLLIDPDTPNFQKAFIEKFGRDWKSLPKTTRHTSGRPNVPASYLYKVPPERWPELENAKSKVKFSWSGTPESQGCADVEIIWKGHCVVGGAHPNAKRDGRKCAPGEGDSQGFYSFLDGASPLDIEVAEAPSWLIDTYLQLSNPPAETPTAEVPGDFPHADAARTREFLRSYFQPASDYAGYDDWLEIGMICHDTSRRTGEEELLLDTWLEWCSQMGDAFNEEECRREWQRWSTKGKTDRPVAFSTMVRRVQIMGKDILHPCQLDRANFKEGSWLAKGAANTRKIWQEIKQQREAVEGDAEEANTARITATLERLYELSLQGEGVPGVFADMAYQRHVLGGFRLQKEEVDRRLLMMTAEKFGIKIGDGTNKQRTNQTLGHDTPTSNYADLIPGFMFQGKDALVAAKSSVGKTHTAVGAAFVVATGYDGGFLDYEGPSMDQGAVLWIGTDGGVDAKGMVKTYAFGDGKNPGVIPREGNHRQEFDKHFVFWGADEETGDTPWAFNVKGLHQLFDELRRGHSTGPYKLVVIDTLKAVMSLGSIDFGIGPVDWAMRLMQGAAAKYGVTVLWLHHLKPGSSRAGGAPDIDALGGNSNINQIPFAVHILEVQERNGVPVRRWHCKKYRDLTGSTGRTFDYQRGQDGMFELVVDEAEPEDELLTQILVHLWARVGDGSPKSDIQEALAFPPRRIADSLTTYSQRQFIKSQKRRWWITGLGLEHLETLRPDLSQEIQKYRATSDTPA